MGAKGVMEQAAIAGILNTEYIFNKDAAEYLAKRMDSVSKDFERGWIGEINETGINISRVLRGVKEEAEISSDIINRPEAKILDKIAAELQELYGKGNKTVTFVNSSGDAEVISGPTSLRDTVFKIGKKGAQVSLSLIHI